MRLPARIAVAAALALFVLGVAVLPLELAPVTHWLSARYSLAQGAGLSQDRMLEVAEQVRAFVIAGEGTLPAEVDGRPGFAQSEVAHLEDVRRVLDGAGWITLALGVGLAAGAAFTALRRGGAAIVPVLKLAAALCVAIPAAAVAWASVDFDAFFSAFHSVLFRSGTWTFPSESLLIEVFPEPFWMTIAAAYAGLVVLGAGLCYLAGVVLERRSLRDGAARRARP